MKFILFCCVFVFYFDRINCITPAQGGKLHKDPSTVINVYPSLVRLKNGEGSNQWDNDDDDDGEDAPDPFELCTSQSMGACAAASEVKKNWETNNKTNAINYELQQSASSHRPRKSKKPVKEEDNPIELSNKPESSFRRKMHAKEEIPTEPNNHPESSHRRRMQVREEETEPSNHPEVSFRRKVHKEEIEPTEESSFRKRAQLREEVKPTEVVNTLESSFKKKVDNNEPEWAENGHQWTTFQDMLQILQKRKH